MRESILFTQNTPREPATAPSYRAWSAAATHAVMRHDMTDRTAGPIPAFGTMVVETALAAQGPHNAYAPAAPLDRAAKPDIAYAAPDNSEYSFADVIDVINPLHHLPVIGTLYRQWTGDVLKPMSNIIGGAIFGGPVGAVGSTIDVIVKDRTGRDIGENALAIVGLARGDAPSPIRCEPLAAANKYDEAEMARKNFARAEQSRYSWNA
jgi:hypothetical protein